MSEQFDSETLRMLSEIEEIDIETVALDAPELHRTTIWIVVVGSDVYVRSVRGPKGQWWRELTASPVGGIFADNQRIPVRAYPVTDEATWARVSEAYTRKYAHDPQNVAPMIVPEALPATVRLEPIAEE